MSRTNAITNEAAVIAELTEEQGKEAVTIAILLAEMSGHGAALARSNADRIRDLRQSLEFSTVASLLSNLTKEAAAMTCAAGERLRILRHEHDNEAVAEAVEKSRQLIGYENGMEERRRH